MFKKFANELVCYYDHLRHRHKSEGDSDSQSAYSEHKQIESLRDPNSYVLSYLGSSLDNGSFGSQPEEEIKCEVSHGSQER